MPLESFPLRGRTIPELSSQNIEGYRELVESPWRIIYKMADDKVYIVCVFDGRRSYESILLNRILSN
jgi:toxin ParE1/3/4